MEAAVCGAKAIALSYAFFDRNHDAGIIADASELSARLIQHLYDGWDSETHLYTVNVPLVENVSARKILWTHMLQNTWRSGSCFQVVDAESESSTAADTEFELRKQESKDDAAPDTKSGDTQVDGKHMRYAHKQFKWAPSFKDVYASVEESSEGNDGWAVANGYTSVTPLRANFMHVEGRKGRFEGEIKL